jgi:2-keto-4-pentenoate hydratase/2-oxohepta-3-ene-1,7-dioic acid hydratase in catechol pathway
MRLCRYSHQGTNRIGFYADTTIIPLAAESDSLLPFLQGGAARRDVVALQAQVEKLAPAKRQELSVSVSEVSLLVPIPSPSKLMLLAGNYAEHIQEGGDRAEERARTFPYVFMKPPLTTLNNPGRPVRIPAVSPNYIDWELELGVIIGKQCRGVAEADALSYVAGYTIVNDISDRKFKPNPGRSPREKDKFFDWLHGKWHDTFCPMGPCVLPADELADPQSLKLTLKVNGQVEQDSSTAEMVFPVAAEVEFI